MGGERKRRGWGGRAVALVALGAALAGRVPAASAATPEKPVIGGVEEVVLLPWRLPVRARVDTGAATSSVDARDIQVRGPRRSRTVRFLLMGDRGQQVPVELPLLEVRRVITGGGREVSRPVVRMEVCFAGVREAIEVTLNDRRRVDYRVLIGRNLLEGRFLVDVDRSLTAAAACPAAR